MEVIPAIDIRGGRCVRLHQGDYDAETVFDADPVAVARRWVDAGARRLHVVDLDGARAGRPVSFKIVAAIAELGAPVQVGGGLRTPEAVARYRDAGVERVILGTAAVRDVGLVEALCREDAGAVVVSLDARDGRIATDGWTRTSEMQVEGLARALVAIGVGRFVYTDIARDGTLTQPNYAAVRRVVVAAGRPVIASGGVSAVAQLASLAETGVEAAIIGWALYDGRVGLPDALAAARAASGTTGQC